MFEFLNRPKIDTADAAPAEGKASATGHAIAWPGAGRVAWSPRDDVSLTRTGFIGNPVGFRAVKITEEAAAALPVVLQDQERRYETHQFKRFWPAQMPHRVARKFLRRYMVNCL